MTKPLLLVLVAAVAWKLYQLAKAPRDAPLRSVTLCLLTASLSYPLAMPGGSNGIDAVAGHGAAKLAQNVLLLLTVYFLMCFYLFSAEGEAGRRRARWEGLLVVLVAVAISVAALSVPHTEFAGSFKTADMTVFPVAFFYAGAGLYLMYALAISARWSRRYARLSRRPHSTGLWMAAISLILMAAACAMRAVFVTIRANGSSVPEPLMTTVAILLVVSILLFAVGITYPGARSRARAVRLWLRHRRDHRRLAALWELLATARPQGRLARALGPLACARSPSSLSPAHRGVP